MAGAHLVLYRVSHKKFPVLKIYCIKGTSQVGTIQILVKCQKDRSVIVTILAVLRAQEEKYRLIQPLRNFRVAKRLKKGLKY